MAREYAFAQPTDFTTEVITTTLAKCAGKTVAAVYIPDDDHGLRVCFTDGTGFIVGARMGPIWLGDLTDADKVRVQDLVKK